MTDYIISEEELNDAEVFGLTPDSPMCKTIRSRPLSSALKKIDRILKHKRGCLTCRDLKCMVWQVADQNCWKSEKEAVKCQTCGGVVTHPMCDTCYENNIENTLQEALLAERERVLDEFMRAIDWRFNDTEKGRMIIKTIQEIKDNLPQNDYPNVDGLQEFPFRTSKRSEQP